MKKMLQICLLLCIVTSSFAQEAKQPELHPVQIGEFKANDTMFKAIAFVNKDSSIVFLYELPATYGGYGAYLYQDNIKIVMPCTPDIVEKLKNIHNKYKEWLAIAKENKVGKFNKKIEIEIPTCYLKIEKKGKASKLEKFKDNHFTFVWKDPEKADGRIYLCTIYKIPYVDIEVECGLFWLTPEDFEKFIEFIDFNNVKKRLKENKVSLFN